jgi:hypothetical protein
LGDIAKKAAMLVGRVPTAPATATVLLPKARVCGSNVRATSVSFRT